MKKFLSLLVMLTGFTCLLFAVSKQRQAIDAFLKEYEAFVVKAEKAADTNKISDLTNLSLESVKLSEKAQNVENTTEWTPADSVKYLGLTNRYAAAINKLSGNPEPQTADTADINDMLKAYGY